VWCVYLYVCIVFFSMYSFSFFHPSPVEGLVAFH
jgi:hypothetical protein